MAERADYGGIDLDIGLRVISSEPVARSSDGIDIGFGRPVGSLTFAARGVGKAYDIKNVVRRGAPLQKRVAATTGGCGVSLGDVYARQSLCHKVQDV